MSGHTPGPWAVESDPHHYDTLSTVTGGGRTDAWPHTRLIVQVGGSADWQEQEANARLIATSPELLEALKAVYAEVSNTEPKGVFGFTSFLPAHIQWQVREAIAKATGEQP